MTDSLKKHQHSNFRSDLIIAIGVLVAVWGIAVYIDLFELIHAYLHKNEHWQLDELLMTFLAVSIVAFWFSYRRWKELEQTSKALQQSEQNKNYIVNNMKVGLLVYQLEDLDDDRTLRLINANPAASEFTGSDINRLVGLTIDQAFPDLRQLGLPQVYAEVIRTGEAFIIDELVYGDERIEKSTFSVRAFQLPEQCVGIVFENTTERSRMKEALKTSEQRLKQMILNAPIPIMVHAEDGNVQLISSKWEELTGYLHEDIPTIAAWTDRAYGELGAEARKVINSLHNLDHSSHDGEYTIQIANGETRTWDFYSTNLGKSDGIKYTVSMAVDITERKLAENEMVESRARFSGIVEMAADAIISINEMQQIVLFNRAAERMFGYRQQEVLGQQVEKLIPERFQEGHRQAVKAFVGTSDAPLLHRRSGMFGRRINGEEFPIETSISKQIIEGETIMTVMMRDLSDQIKAEDTQRKLLKAIVEAGEAVLITNASAIIEYVNPAFCKITGYTEQDVIGKNPSILKSDAQDPKFYQQMWRTITRGDVWHGTLIDRKKDGSFYPALMTVSPIHDEKGEISHYVSLQQDMTDYKKMEDQFLQAQKMEAIGTLVGGIAHDFNNMLAAIQGNSYLARMRLQKDDSAGADEKIGNIEQLTNSAAEMVKQLLTFSRKDSVAMKTFLLNPFLKEALKLAETAIPENINLHSVICHDKLYIRGDATQLQQVLMNLLNNARDALARVEHPNISISLAPYQADETFIMKHSEIDTEKMARITVQDNGSGIAEENITKVFEPFFTSKGVGKGTGLGLAMVFGAIQTHGGIIELDSRLGEGTGFSIYLPLVSEQEAEYQPKKTELKAGNNETLLLVDDEPMLRATTLELLSNLGYRVLEASDGVEGLEVFTLHQQEIQLVITDLVMPRMGGVDLIKQLRSQGSDVPAIFVTGYDKDQALDIGSGIDQSIILNKPFDLNYLSHVIQELLSSE